MAKQSKGQKASAELFSLTYGALVSDLLRDYEDPLDVNAQLDKMGFSIGTRLADDFLSKNVGVPRCTDTRQMADVLAKQVLLTYLGTQAQVTNWAAGDKEFSLLLEQNPLTELVEVPECYSSLNYCQLVAGAIRGGLEAVHMKVTANVVDNPQYTEIRIRFEHLLRDSLPSGDDA